MVNDEGIPSIGEVLEVLATYRVQLVAEQGEQQVQNLPISDEWGDGRTSATLLLKEPGRWEYLLEDEKTRGRIYKTVLSLQESLAGM